MSEYTNGDCRRMVREALGDLPQPYALGTSGILMERLPLTPRQIYVGMGAIIHQPRYDNLVIRSEVASGLDGWTEIITEERKAYHQERIDKAKLKAKNKREFEKQQKAAQKKDKKAKVIALERPVSKSTRPIITIRKRCVIQYRAE